MDIVHITLFPHIADSFMLILLISHENNKCTKSHKNQVCIQITSVVQQDHSGMKKMKLSSSLLSCTMLLIKINIQCTCTYM